MTSKDRITVREYVKTNHYDIYHFIYNVYFEDI